MYEEAPNVLGAPRETYAGMLGPTALVPGRRTRARPERDAVVPLAEQLEWNVGLERRDLAIVLPLGPCIYARRMIGRQST
jgi:hypothetical protein